MKINSKLMVLFITILASCSPTIKTIKIGSNTPSFIFTPTTTSTITPTIPPGTQETPEAKFSVCAIENYKNCPITVTQLFDGTYKNWLESSPQTKFDPENINDVPLVHHDDGRVYYHVRNAPNFTGVNEGKEPFNRNVTFGFTEYEGQSYLVMPIEYYDRNHPDKNQWVITVNNISGLSDDGVREQIQIWKNNMRITPWVDGNILFYNPNPDPLIALTLDKYPNLKELVDRFSDTKKWGDKTALDLPGIVFLNYIAVSDGHWYE